MARPGRPERNRAARSFRQLRRFHHLINSDKVFGTHKSGTGLLFDLDRDLPNEWAKFKHSGQAFSFLLRRDDFPHLAAGKQITIEQIELFRARDKALLRHKVDVPRGVNDQLNGEKKAVTLSLAAAPPVLAPDADKVSAVVRYSLVDEI